MKQTNAKILLLTIFIARGTSFIFSKYLMNDLTPTGILAVRFILAFLILAVIFNKKIRHCSLGSMKGGLILGVLYTVCMFFEMYGLKLIDSGVSSFIENTAIVLVPIYAAVITRKLPKLKTVICAVLAVAGVGLLSVTQVSVGINWGVILTIGAALSFAACVMVTEKVSQNGDPITIGMIQLGTMGVLSLIFSLCTGNFCMPKTGVQWGMLLLLVLVCSCFGFTFQPVGQKYVSAETAAVFTVVNPLTASILGIFVAHEGMSVMKGAGYAVILLALLLYNFDIESRIKKRKNKTEA